MHLYLSIKLFYAGTFEGHNYFGSSEVNSCMKNNAL